MKFGFIGAGRWATAFALAVAEAEGVSVSGIFAPDQSAAELAGRLQIAPTPTVEQVFSASDVIMIGSPTDTHESYIRQASGALKPFLCSSPATLLGTRLETHKAAASFPWRFTPEFQRLKEGVDKNEIGTLGTIRLGMCRPRPTGWQAERVRSGGILLDAGTQVLDYLQYAFGAIDRIFSMDSSSNAAGGEYALLLARMANGAIAHLELSWNEAPGLSYDYYEVAGSTGLMDYDSRNEPVMVMETQEGHSSRSIGSGMNFARFELDEFLKFLNGDASKIVTFNEGLERVRLVVSLRDSADQARPVVLNERV